MTPATKAAFEKWAATQTPGSLPLVPAPEGCVHADYYSGVTQLTFAAFAFQQAKLDKAMELLASANKLVDTLRWSGSSREPEATQWSEACAALRAELEQT